MLVESRLLRFESFRLRAAREVSDAACPEHTEQPKHPMHLGALWLCEFFWSWVRRRVLSCSLSLCGGTLMTWRRLVDRAACTFVCCDLGFFSLTTSKRKKPLLSHRSGILNILIWSSRPSCSSHHVDLAVADCASPFFFLFPSIFSLSDALLRRRHQRDQRQTCRTGRLLRPTATRAEHHWPTGEDGTSRQRQALAPRQK